MSMNLKRTIEKLCKTGTTYDLTKEKIKEKKKICSSQLPRLLPNIYLKANRIQ